MDDQLLKRLGEIVLQLRHERGLLQTEAAHELGVTNVYLCNLERGKQRPSLAMMDLIQLKWGVNPYVEAKINPLR